jgi:6-phosphogluconolactonase
MNLSRDQFLKKATSIILSEADNSIRERNIFHIVLAGGETPRAIYRSLRNAETDWSAWHFWYCDERCLPLGHYGLNSTMISNELFQFITVNELNIHRIKVESGIECAVDGYSKELKQAGIFDLTILGLGEDGHTASLFPGNKMIGDKNDDVIAVFDAPKLPTQRISLSAKRLCRSRVVMFLAAGKEKKNVVDAYIRNKPMPATTIKGEENTVLLYSFE